MDIREVYCSSADKSNSKLQLLIESHRKLEKENTVWVSEKTIHISYSYRVGWDIRFHRECDLSPVVDDTRGKMFGVINLKSSHYFTGSILPGVRLDSFETEQ